MYIEHGASYYADAYKILKEGIRSAIETGNHRWRGISDPTLIYLSVSPFEKYGEDSYFNSWGDFIFVLNDDWVRKNSDQFCKNFDEEDSEEVPDLKYWGIGNNKPKHFYDYFEDYDDIATRCIVSTKNIPIEALELLVIHESTFEESEYYAKMFLPEIPEHMGLFIYDNSLHKVIRIK